ncbi:CDP-alcohol phosphatidyltransferase family protein [uncultured Winogradskyella sp.]|uniref:CDP-alcohol phosphatidyltransferase family protein n=1 Tax=uncultured Winogradskyella sp. TaxID=395353 RepID=UPI002606673C|nr:CDP-alcohol phosphatidyltransferase family protein [uncultured Winogradskyella sp.]
MMDILSDKHIETWSIYNAFAMTTALIIALVSKQLSILLVVFSISIIALIFINRKKLLNTRPIFGIANTLTLVRFLIIVLSFYLISFNDTNLLFYSLSIAVILDFFDGIAARYFNESSFFGQYFDMEIDAFFVLIMCYFYYTYGGVSWWILIPGALRYLFRIYTFCFPKPDVKEDKKTYATVIAASYFIILLIGLITSGTIQFLILLIGSLAIAVSFLIGIIQYHK